MGWASRYIETLKTGSPVSFRPRGNSMAGRINSGQLVTVSPDLSGLKVNDAVLCIVKGNEYLHLIKAFDGDRVQIGNNHGFINGWTSLNKIFGVVTKVQN